MLPDGTPVSLHRIPSSKDRLDVRKQWLCAISNVRQDMKPVLKPSARICNAHFPNYIVTKSSMPNDFPTANKPHIEKAKRRTIHKNIPEPVLISATFVEPGIESESIGSQSSVESPSIDTSIDMECQTETIPSSDMNIQVGMPFVTTTNDASTQTMRPDISVEDMAKNDEKVRFYTGYVNFSMFMLMFNTFLKHGASKLNYWDGEKQSMGEKTFLTEDRNKPGRKRTLRPVDEFLLVMMRLRLGLLQEHLGDIFKISTSTVSRTLNTWINFMFDHCKGLVPYPSPDQIKFNIPRAFHEFPNCQIIIDCTEFFTEKPSNLSAQWKTWSEYKHHNTLKLLVGVTPSGMVSYISRLWGGSSTS